MYIIVYDEALLSDIHAIAYTSIAIVIRCRGFSTYAIVGKRGSGEISLNGAAARLAQLGDLLIICTYAPMSDAEVAEYQPKIVFVNDKNRITGLKK